MRSINIAATGMKALEKQTAIIANNIANISTTAYKKNAAAFKDLVYQSDSRVGSNPSGDVIIPTGNQIGLGSMVGSTYRTHQQGELKETGNNFDVAINGKGYFAIEDANGDTKYTRAGNFTLNQNGEIVTTEGYIVKPGITIPEGIKEVDISRNGRVSTLAPGAIEFVEQGVLEVTTFINENGLKAVGSNLFEQTEASGEPIIGEANTEDRGYVMQGYLESANVNPINELTELISAQRGYELGSKSIQAGDEMMQTINNSKR